MPLLESFIGLFGPIYDSSHGRQATTTSFVRSCNSLGYTHQAQEVTLEPITFTHSPQGGTFTAEDSMPSALTSSLSKKTNLEW